MIWGRFLARVTLVSLVGQLIFVQSAQAYLDPGTGSMIIQGVIAAVVGGLFAIKVYWRRIKTFLFSRGTAPEDNMPKKAVNKDGKD